MRLMRTDVPIFLQQRGSGSETLLMFHGWGMTGESWRPLAQRLSADWQMLIPDLRGFGRSAKPPNGYHINNYLADAVRLAQRFHLRRITVVGHSFGGTGALYLAARLPHLVSKAVVLSTIPGAKSPAVDPRIQRHFARIQALSERAGDRQLATLLHRLWRQSLALPPSLEIEDSQRRAADGAARHAVLATLHTILSTDITPWLARIGVPTLIVRGQLDPLLGDGRDGLEAIPDAVRVTMPTAGHYPQLEDPDGLAAHMRRFLTNL